jgi:hypothetical protein
MLKAKFWRDDHYFQMAARPSGLPIKKGTQGGSYPRQTIAKFQFALLSLAACGGRFGLPVYQFNKLAVTGEFDQRTENAVEDFQAKEGLRIDGKAQVETLHKMDERLAAIESSTPEQIEDFLKALKRALSGGIEPSSWKDTPTGPVPGGTVGDVMGGLMDLFRGK